MNLGLRVSYGRAKTVDLRMIRVMPDITCGPPTPSTIAPSMKDFGPLRTRICCGRDVGGAFWAGPCPVLLWTASCSRPRTG